MQVGFTTVTFRQKSIEEVFEIAKKNGIKLIEWGGDKHLPIDDEVALSKIKQLSIQNNIQCFSYGSYYRVGERDFEKFEKICIIAKEIGAKIIRIWLGGKSSFFTSKMQFEGMAEETKKLCTIAKKYDLIIAGEFHQKTFNDCGKSSLKMLKKVDMPNFKTYWQPLGHEKKDYANLKQILDYVSVVHIFNWKNFDERYEFAYNSERWAKFFELIKGNSDIVGIMEFVKDDSEKQFAIDFKTINKMIEG